VYPGDETNEVDHAPSHSATVGSIKVSPDGRFSSPQMLRVELGKSGSGRQGAPHPHDAVLDPTGSFVIVPDLGSDHVRIFHISPETGELAAQAPVDVPRGSGPRHAAFHCPVVETSCWMYLVSEIGNKVTAFRVSYPSTGQMKLEEIQSTNSFGGKDPPRGTFGAAEIEVSVSLRAVPEAK
jgi:6-phosphogluconolactonase (cycloisomerase 2 family)